MSCTHGDRLLCCCAPPRYSGFSPSYAPADTDMSGLPSSPPILTFNGSDPPIPYSPSFPWRLLRNTLPLIPHSFIYYYKQKYHKTSVFTNCMHGNWSLKHRCVWLVSSLILRVPLIYIYIYTPSPSFLFYSLSWWDKSSLPYGSTASTFFSNAT